MGALPSPVTHQGRELISLEYLGQQKWLHVQPRGYGAKGAKWKDTVLALATQLEATSILDYGCGQGGLGRALESSCRKRCIRLAEYDPAIEGKDGRPSFADIVTCTDVLEHIEPANLEAVLTHLYTLARRAMFTVVALDPANKTLKDGTNAHLIQQPPDWWRERTTAAGFVEDIDLLRQLPLPLHYTPEKIRKRWIAVLRTC
jgi:hypothetical protein